MRRLVGLAWRLLLLAGLLLAGLLLAATSPQPSVQPGAALSHADLERGRELLRALGLRRLHDGQIRRIALTPEDLDLGLHILAGQLALGAARVTLEEGRLLLRASWRLPGVPRYLNLKLALAPSEPMLLPVELRLGRLPLPAGPTARAALFLLAHGAHGPQLAVARDMLLRAEIIDGKLHLTFIWHGRALAEALQQPGVDSTALDAYREALAMVRGNQFTTYLGRAFALAGERSANGDAVAENRAALTALAERVLGGRLVGARGIVVAPRDGTIVLDGRVDFAQHFAISAYLAATGGTHLSELVGEYKELRDAREGSGFSFTDLGADRAGTRLGEFCASPEGSKRCQSTLAAIEDGRVFFPPLHDLPEFLGEAEFKRRFGGIDAPAYQLMVRIIDTRIGDLPLYQDWRARQFDR